MVSPSAIRSKTGGKRIRWHMLSINDLNSAELETERVSKSPTTVAVQTKEEATVYVKELD